MRVRKEFLLIVVVLSGVLAFTYYETGPIKKLMDWRASKNTQAVSDISVSDYEIYDHAQGNDPDITVDFVKGKNFWNPQIVIWLEDSAGNYIETLLVTESTARGLFYSGRTVSNFKESDETKADENTPTRRVDALPYWSHKRNHRYADGFYSPPPGEPMPDGITGATPKDNFYFKSTSTDISKLNSFRVMVEFNVAFDENEFYSEYDFLEDSLYHSGTGLLGQPSLIYGITVHKSDNLRYYVLPLLGRGHHSGSSGELFQNMETVTTAKYVVERIVIGVNENWY